MTLRGGAAREAETTRGATCDAVDNYLSDYWAQDELVAAAHDGVALRVVVIPEANGAASALRWLRRHDVTALGAAAEPYLHAKVLVCATARGATAVLVLTDAFGDHAQVTHSEDGDGPRPNDRSSPSCGIRRRRDQARHWGAGPWSWSLVPAFATPA